MLKSYLQYIFAIYILIANKGIRKARDIFKLKKIVSKKYGLKEFDNKKIIFVHIPKCAGISVNVALYNNYGGMHRTAKLFGNLWSKKI